MPARRLPGVRRGDGGGVLVLSAVCHGGGVAFVFRGAGVETCGIPGLRPLPGGLGDAGLEVFWVLLGEGYAGSFFG